ncbi:hypothetical protein SCUP234_04967 [Seiridium cupressi]
MLCLRRLSCPAIICCALISNTLGRSIGVPPSSEQEPAHSTIETRGTSSNSSSRATWVWETADMVNSNTKSNAFITFAKQNNVTMAYVHVDPDVAINNFKAFVTKCVNSGIVVEALMGNAIWVKQSGDDLTNRLSWVAQYQKATAGTASLQVKGLHLDVESVYNYGKKVVANTVVNIQPWVLSDWTANMATYIRGWENLTSTLKTWANTQQPPLPLAADLPFWLNTLNATKGGRLDKAIMTILDSATIMSYRNSASALMDVAGAALQMGKTLNKPVWLGVETCQSQEGNYISYYGLGKKKLTADLASITKLMGTRNAGIAVQNNDCWAAMR